MAIVINADSVTRMILRRLFGSAFAATLISTCPVGTARAATVSTSIGVTATVVDTCTVAVQNPSAAAAAALPGSVNTNGNCDRGSPYTLKMGSAAGSGATTSARRAGQIDDSGTTSVARESYGRSAAGTSLDASVLVVTVTY